MPRWLAAMMLAAACGDDGGGGDAAVPISDAGIDAESWDVDDLRGACAQNTRSGELQLNHDPNGETGSFSAAISDGLEPNKVLTALEESGECRLYRKENHVCDLPCGPTLSCGEGGVCVPRPILQDVGAMEVFGLDAPLTPPNQLNQYFDTTLPNPPFTPGQKVRVVASGSAEHEPFELRGLGVPLVVVPETAPLMRRDTDFTIAWDTTGSLGDVWVKVTVDQHGNTPVSLICVGVDDGELTVAASLVNTFLDYGITGVPNFVVERRTADSIETEDGCVELRVFSTGLGVFSVEGHTPCSAATPDCPPPLVCNLATETCE